MSKSQPITVAIDTSPLNSLSMDRGIGVYAKELISALEEYPDLVSVIHIQKPSTFQADLIHYPFFDLFFHTLPIRRQLPTVVTIHDVIPLVFKRVYPPGIKGTIRNLLQLYALKSAEAVITDSNTSALDIASLLDYPAHKTHAIYLAANSQFSPPKPSAIKKYQAKFAFTRPYFLYVGDINYNKNVNALIEAFTAHSQTHDLVLVCKALANPIPEALAIKALITRLELNQKIHILSGLSESELAYLYASAEAYVQPSLYEGFGFPVLEAQKSGALVISSTAGSLSEIMGEGTLQAKPTVESLQAAMSQAIRLKKNEREHRINQGFVNAKRFSWSLTAKQTIAVYQSALEKLP